MKPVDIHLKTTNNKQMATLIEQLKKLTPEQAVHIANPIEPKRGWKNAKPTEPFNGLDLISRIGVNNSDYPNEPYCIQLDFNENVQNIRMYTSNLTRITINGGTLKLVFDYLNSLDETQQKEEDSYSVTTIKEAVNRILRKLSTEDLIRWQQLDLIGQMFKNQTSNKLTIAHIELQKNEIITIKQTTSCV